MANSVRYKLVYGTGAVSLGESEDKGFLQKAADKLNKQAPEYNHRVEEIPKKKS